MNWKTIAVVIVIGAQVATWPVLAHHHAQMSVPEFGNMARY